jgi:hypothetical protein
MAICVPRLITGKAEDIHFPLVRNKELRADEGTQFKCVLLSFVVGVDPDKTNPELKPWLDIVRDTWVSQIVSSVVTLRIIDIAPDNKIRSSYKLSDEKGI